MSLGGGFQQRVVLALPVEKVVQRRVGGRGECLGCGEEGFLIHPLGEKWRVRKAGDGSLIHKVGCQINRYLLHQKPTEKR